jgi:hypothetical protein
LKKKGLLQHSEHQFYKGRLVGSEIVMETLQKYYKYQLGKGKSLCNGGIEV